MGLLEEMGAVGSEFPLVTEGCPQADQAHHAEAAHFEDPVELNVHQD